jgi:protein tyrosine phosphatase (PTP) superfamily phosphohydrolase (DUF442 family)
MSKTLTSLAIPLLTLSALLTMGFGSQLVSDDTHFTSSISWLATPYNFHAVVDDQLFRSAEMPKEALQEHINRYGITTVIDLRLGGGENLKKKGYSEKALLEELGVRYIWVPLAGTHTRQKKGMERLISLAQEVEGPVLIHCDSGSHRSGIASTIWLMSRYNFPPEKAAMQLHPSYGFYYWERRMKGFFLGTQTIDHIIWNYLAEHRNSSVDFQTWVSQNTNPL